MHSYNTSDNIINNTGMPLLSDGGPVIELKTIDIYDRGRHSLAAFSDASQFCRLAWANGSNVLIYCLTGIDASPVIAVAIIMEMTGMACVDAMHWVQMRRRCTNIRGVYLRLLEEYEPVLYAQQTTMNETALAIDPSLHGSLQQQSSKRLRDHNNDHEDDETMGHSHRKNLLLDSTATDSNANSASPITICTLPINWSGPN
ncbi:hypothetical protein BDF19DRAFT_282492 [Syncephalis fuscata]|nr:hypothetical protein BDF19DRAFT_282492 [Syncephalis fuscata]